MVLRNRGLLGSNLSRKPCMKVYDQRELSELLGVGILKAYEIMRNYGFRIGYTDRSPLRITEEGVRAWVEHQQTMTTASAKTQSNG